VQKWNSGSFYEASTSVNDREAKLSAAYEEVERVSALWFWPAGSFPP